MTFNIYVPEKISKTNRVKKRALRIFISASTIEKRRKASRTFFIHNGRRYVKKILTGASNMQIFGEFVQTKLTGGIVHNEERRRLKRAATKKKRQVENLKRRLERKREREEIR